ncbi:MAG TPA: hypothetical protein VGK01_20320 [Candidatus Angelobacter sp.]|jgi:nitric oxide reductase large subunit
MATSAQQGPESREPLNIRLMSGFVINRVMFVTTITVPGIFSGILVSLFETFAHLFKTGYLDYHGVNSVWLVIITIACSCLLYFCQKLQDKAVQQFTNVEQVPQRVATMIKNERIIFVISFILGAVISGYFNLHPCK